MRLPDRLAARRRIPNAARALMAAALLGCGSPGTSSPAIPGDGGPAPSSDPAPELTDAGQQAAPQDAAPGDHSAAPADGGGGHTRVDGPCALAASAPIPKGFAPPPQAKGTPMESYYPDDVDLFVSAYDTRGIPGVGQIDRLEVVVWNTSPVPYTTKAMLGDCELVIGNNMGRQRGLGTGTTQYGLGFQTTLQNNPTFKLVANAVYVLDVSQPNKGVIARLVFQIPTIAPPTVVTRAQLAWTPFPGAEGTAMGMHFDSHGYFIPGRPQVILHSQTGSAPAGWNVTDPATTHAEVTWQNPNVHVDGMQKPITTSTSWAFQL